MLLFFLLFESYISYSPFGCSPIGGCIPSMLHFPIALMLLALLLEFFRFRPEFQGPNLSSEFLQDLSYCFPILNRIARCDHGSVFVSKRQGYFRLGFFFVFSKRWFA